MDSRPEEVGSGPDRRFACAFPASTAELSRPRQVFIDWLASDTADPEEVQELAVVYSELISNAATHRPDLDGSIRTEAWHDGDDIVLTVENPDPDDGPGVRQWDLDDALRGGGRGLLLVRAFTDSFEALRSARGALVIRCRRRLYGR